MLINLRNALMAGKRLPYDAEVEYLESTGTQWIDTGVKKTSGTTIDCTFSLAATNTKAVFGGRTGAANSDRLALFAFNSNFRFDAGDQKYLYTPDTTSKFRFQYDGTNAILTNLTTGVVDTQAVGIGDAGTVNIVLFGVSTNGEISAKLEGRIYSFKIWQNGVLVRDYIPVRVGSGASAVGYLYDRVSGKLFGNAGTGDFVLGADVVPVEWLGSGANTYINTGIIPDDTYGMEVTGYTTQTNDSAWIGTRNSSNQRCFMGYSPSLGFYYGWNGRQDIQYTTGVWSTASMNLYNSRKNMMDGTEVGSIVETLGAQNRAIYLFGLTANGTVGLKLKNALITKGSDDVLKLVSVRVGTDATSWEGAMMDTLTRRIYRNAGTGAFTFGNDLKYPIPAE